MKLLLGSLLCCSTLMANSSYSTNEECYTCAPQDATWFVNGSFLYYYASEDGLDIADSAGLSTGITSIAVTTENSQVALQNFQYQPGFQVGLGLDYHEWKTTLQYTWIRQSTTINKKPIPTEFDGGVWVFNNWFQQTTTAGQTLFGSTFSSQWDLGIDLADLMIERTFCPVYNLTISPFAGLRGAWIRQKLDIHATVPENVVDDLTSLPIYSHNSSRSWAVGPRAGFDIAWLLDYGFRAEANAAISLLYTQYTDITHHERAASDTAIPSILGTQLKDVNCVRPELDLGLGLGWRSYFCQDQYYIDILASYQFLYFWDQNMIRKLADETVAGTGASPSDLSLQGLNIQISFGF